MIFKDSEGVRFLADHIKSIWALSAGGIAFGSGLLGLISKDVTIPRYAYTLCLVFVFGGLCAFTYSVWRGIQAHKQLTDEVFKSEQVTVTGMHAKASLESVLKTYYRSRKAFFVGCLALAVGVLGFVVWNNLIRKQSSPDHLLVSLKNAILVTQDSRKIEIEALSFKIDLRSSPPYGNTVEIQDLVFEGRTLAPTR
jgi:hypothetical protein